MPIQNIMMNIYMIYQMYLRVVELLFYQVQLIIRQLINLTTLQTYNTDIS